MKVLVATRETQGAEGGDFSFTVDGELVTAAGLECSNPGCGCDRGFGGLASHRATTTAEVVELDIDPDEYWDAVHDSLADQGWIALLEDADEDALELVDAHVESVAVICRSFPVGAIVRRRRSTVWWSSSAAA